MAEFRSASLPSSVRLKGWVTTAKGLACTVAMVSPEGSPVQLTLTELDAVSPVRRKGWDSLPVPDWPLAEKVHDGSVEAPAAVTVEVTPRPTNMDPAPIPITAPSPTSFRQKRRPPELPAPELIFDNIVPPVCWMCPPAGELAPSARDCRSLNPAVNTRGCASVGVRLCVWSENGHEHGSLCDIGKCATCGRCGCQHMDARLGSSAPGRASQTAVPSRARESKGDQQGKRRARTRGRRCGRGHRADLQSREGPRGGCQRASGGPGTGQEHSARGSQQRRPGGRKCPLGCGKGKGKGRSRVANPNRLRGLRRPSPSPEREGGLLTVCATACALQRRNAEPGPIPVLLVVLQQPRTKKSLFSTSTYHLPS